MRTDSKNPIILIKINGKDKSIPLGTSILRLLEIYKINKEKVVIELNKKIVNKDLVENTIVNENDELEIVTFVGGG